MLRFAGKNSSGRKVIGLGITAANVAEMAKGRPIRVRTEDFELDEAIDITIFYGPTLEALQKQFAPLVGPNTKVTIDPLLQAGVPEDAKASKDGQHRGSSLT